MGVVGKRTNDVSPDPDTTYYLPQKKGRMGDQPFDAAGTSETGTAGGEGTMASDLNHKKQPHCSFRWHGRNNRRDETMDF